MKDHEDRYVPIPKTTARMLAELLVTLKDNIYFILLTPNRNREIVAKWQEHRRLGKPWTNGRMANNMLVSFRRHAKWAGIADHKTITIHSLRKSCGVNWANNLPLHVTQAYMGHADIETTQQYYLSVGEEHAERASWVIEQITMGSDDTTDARVTPAPENQANRKVG